MKSSIEVALDVFGLHGVTCLPATDEEPLLKLKVLLTSFCSPLPPRAVTCQQFGSGTCRSVCRLLSCRNINMASPAWRSLQTGNTSSAWATSTTWWSTCGTGRCRVSDVCLFSLPVSCHMMFLCSFRLVVKLKHVYTVHTDCLCLSEKHHCCSQ